MIQTSARLLQWPSLPNLFSEVGQLEIDTYMVFLLVILNQRKSAKDKIGFEKNNVEIKLAMNVLLGRAPWQGTGVCSCYKKK